MPPASSMSRSNEWQAFACVSQLFAEGVASQRLAWVSAVGYALQLSAWLSGVLRSCQPDCPSGVCVAVVRLDSPPRQGLQRYFRRSGRVAMARDEAHGVVSVACGAEKVIRACAAQNQAILLFSA